MEYLLMHKNKQCGMLDIDENGHLLRHKITDPYYAPYMGHSSAKLMNIWWTNRAIPASRTMMYDIIKKAGCNTSEEYLVKNLAVSITDTYWIVPVEMDISWEDIRFNNFQIFNNGMIPYHNASSYDVNASLGGQMNKYWNLNGETPVLVKEAYEEYGLQAANEAFATWIHKLQQTDIPYTHYVVSPKKEGGLVCMCDAFTDENVELVSAYEVIMGTKEKKSISTYEHYIDLCVQNGIEQKVMQDFMDYQTLTDFIIANRDEHFNNFGVLRDTESMKLVAPAPIYDSGNSMYFRVSKSRPLEKHELLSLEITSCWKSEETVLKHIKNRNIVNLEKLPSKDEVCRFYQKMLIPEPISYVIAENYTRKVDMALDFQNGKRITAYLEKQKYKALQRMESAENPDANHATLTVLCGIPGSGIQKEAEKIKKQYFIKNINEADAESLYSIDQAMIDSVPLLDYDQIIEQRLQEPFRDNEHFVYISANEIKKNLIRKKGSANAQLVRLICDARIAAALSCGYSVIYNDSNLNKESREHIQDLAHRANVQDTKLVIQNVE